MSTSRYDVRRVLDDFEKWIFENDYTYRQVRGFTGISESMTCNILKRDRSVSDKTLYAICKALGKDLMSYVIGCESVYDSMSIDELNELLDQITAVRDRKLGKETHDETDNIHVS